MTQEEKAKAYDKALESIKELYSKGSRVVVSKEEFETIFHELKENDDERIRKELLESFKYQQRESRTDKEWLNGIKLSEVVAWLEKQGKKPKKVSIWKHWKDGIAGGSEGEQIFLIKIGRIYSISSCLGCECDYIELSELEKLNNRFIIGADTGDPNGDKGIIT